MEDLKIIIKGKELTPDQVNVFYQILGNASYLKGFRDAAREAHNLGVDAEILKQLRLISSRNAIKMDEETDKLKKLTNYPEFEK